LTLAIEPAAHAIAVDWYFGRIEQLVVQDTAPGVSAAHLDKLFEPLFRGDAARTGMGQHVIAPAR
jgi:signal transduction histidine kinase